MPLLATRAILRTSQTVAVSLAVFITIRDQLVEFDTVKGNSMAPTLSPSNHVLGLSDRVVIQRARSLKDLQRGDIVTFWKPHKPEEISIKRVIALEGDQVWPRDREMGTIGGYGGHGVRSTYETGSVGSVTVPLGHVWVEGDNWRASFDSNDFGPISKGLIDGKAIYIIRKWWQWIPIPEKKNEKGQTRVRPGRPVIPDAYLN